MKILAINPGSTSTKIAVYEDETPLLVQIIRHSVEDLAPFLSVNEQFDFRMALVLSKLEEAGMPLCFDAIIGRGGILKPIQGGVYAVNEVMKHALTHSYKNHASNLGGLMADQLAAQIPGCRAFIADPVVTDELDEVARLTGIPSLPRTSVFHALNQKAVARRYAREHNTTYERLNLIVCHLGGGISIAVHRQGRIVDVNNALDGEGPFSPQRAGTLPSGDLIDLCFSGKMTREELKKNISVRTGLTAYLGTTDVAAIVQSIYQGDKRAELVLNAMIYNIAKSVGGAATVLCGQVEAIILTGGIAYSDYVVSRLKERISFLASVIVYPGEDEMEALANNALGALKGELPVCEYK
ncbi:Butyrate kinase 2 [termite gut metagenome]|uniref:Butyrate kinase 2 n=1 Tax=termite gut metagenome TaxID=433724 RepID=A0A5J4RLU5_9ZZZZ